MKVVTKIILLTAVLLQGLQTSIQPTLAQTSIPRNMGQQLRQLVELYRKNPQAAFNELKTVQGMSQMLHDAEGERPLVSIHLDGKVPIEQVVESLKQVGFTVTATNPSFAKGIIEGYLPLSQAVTMAQMPGVFSINPIFSPVNRVGKVTSQAVEGQQVQPVLNLSVQGLGIKIGVLSNSYDAYGAIRAQSPQFFPVPTAAEDIASGDLPGPSNPLGNTTPITVLPGQDLTLEQDPGTILLSLRELSLDEGRAMLQLIHDLAPKAALGYATAFRGPVSFADNIRRLRREFGADIIVDDVGYFTEPFYSDGQVAQAVEDVVREGAAYFSAAGNDGQRLGFEGVYTPVTRQAAQSLVGNGQQNLSLTTVPPELASSFYDFDLGAGVDISQNITVSTLSGGVGIFFQWDEPFIPGKVSTDYNLLVFDRSGRFLGNLSGTDDNPNTAQALEVVGLPPGDYQLVIGLANTQLTAARRIKYIPTGDLTGEYLSRPVRVYGHPAARGAIAVAAADYRTPTQPADFSSRGPAFVFFDAIGNQLRNPIRFVPQITGITNVDNTFFRFPPQLLPELRPELDRDTTGFPNFSGTSASAPSVAAVAALALEAAGGPGRLTPQQLYSVLLGTATDIATPNSNDDTRLGPDFATGFGLVNAEKAIQLLESKSPTPVK